MSALTYLERPASGTPAGLLVLHHGRGSDERDLLGLADLYDPEQRLHVVTPRGPLTLPGMPGAHWYVVPRVGYPDPATFQAAFDQLAAFHDQQWERTRIGPERTVLGGFSMGAVMSYSLGLAGSRPVPGGILAHSGFIPTVEGWAADLTSRPELPVLITHGQRDPIMSIDFARDARATLAAGELPVEYVETSGGHLIEPAHATAGRAWVAERVAAWDRV